MYCPDPASSSTSTEASSLRSTWIVELSCRVRQVTANSAISPILLDGLELCRQVASACRNSRNSTDDSPNVWTSRREFVMNLANIASSSAFANTWLSACPIRLADDRILCVRPRRTNCITKAYTSSDLRPLWSPKRSACSGVSESRFPGLRSFVSVLKSVPTSVDIISALPPSVPGSGLAVNAISINRKALSLCLGRLEAIQRSVTIGDV
mmetsp:Transcript_25374/g.59378  ORF Transcript_25374/g.59378 Transcript_25374/m.59378 type:complete len:210 (-) Transcript_25374:847-1476(-)